jgi:hypothetical protein
MAELKIAPLDAIRTGADAAEVTQPSDRLAREIQNVCERYGRADDLQDETKVVRTVLEAVRVLPAELRREYYDEMNRREFAKAPGALCEQIAVQLCEPLRYRLHREAEERQRIVDFSGTDPALGRLGVPPEQDAMKYRPAVDNRDVLPKVRNSDGGL